MFQHEVSIFVAFANSILHQVSLDISTVSIFIQFVCPHLHSVWCRGVLSPGYW